MAEEKNISIEETASVPHSHLKPDNRDETNLLAPEKIPRTLLNNEQSSNASD